MREIASTTINTDGNGHLSASTRLHEAILFEDKSAEVMGEVLFDPYIPQPTKTYLPHVIEKAIQKQQEFDHAYWKGEGNFEEKYNIAHALIQDGRYSNPLFLVRNFFPPKNASITMAKRKEIEREGKPFRDGLTMLLMEKGVLSPDSSEAESLENEVPKFIESNDDLRQLQDILPIHVMGAITNALRFEGVTDAKKRERLRSWTTRALLRPYLGDIALKPTRGGEIDLRDLLQLVPEGIFKDPDTATYHIVKDYLQAQALLLFSDGDDKGYCDLEDTIFQTSSPLRADFLRGILQDLRAEDKIPIPPVFKDRVEGWQTDFSAFPNRWQKHFVSEFLKSRRKLVNAQPGGAKTASFYLAAETLGAIEPGSAQKILIIGPAKARNTWPREAHKIFKEEDVPDVFTVRGIKDLQDSRIESAKYVFISSDLLGRSLEDSRKYDALLTALVKKRRTDMVCLDESDEFRNPDAKQTRMLVELMSRIQKAHIDRNPIKPLPIAALTATPIASSLKDLDTTMALLYPERFALPSKHEEDKFPFSVQVFRDPQFAYTLLHGEKLMMRWTLKDMFGEKAPQLTYERVSLPMTPFQEVLYNWASSLPVDTLTKIRLQRNVLLNPELIKKVCKDQSLSPAPIYTESELVSRLEQLHEEWMRWIIEKDPRIPDEPFSANWITKYGAHEFLLQCFFDASLNDGVDSLARKQRNISQDWESTQDPSPKYRFIRESLLSLVPHDQNGHVVPNFTPTEQLFIAVPNAKHGITRDFEDPDIKDEDLDVNIYSLYEHLHLWLPGLSKEMTFSVDGGRSFAFRDSAAQLWREDGMRNNFGVANTDAIDESGDWAIRDRTENENIQQATVIFPFWPWGWDNFEQMAGRFLRPGQAKPMNFYVLETENSIDQGFYDSIRKKNLLIQMALEGGLQLNDDDLAFLKKTHEAKRIILVQPTAGQAFLRDIVRRLKSQGEHAIQGELEKDINGKTAAELFAEFYFDEGKDEFRPVGNNAEMVKNVILRTNPRRVLSVGAGTCLLARKAREAGYQGEIDNLDINYPVLKLAAERFPDIGNLIHQGAAELQVKPEWYDAIDCSFMLPWTKLLADEKVTKSKIHEIERVKILRKINESLKFHGTAVFAFPESSFDEETFQNFAGVLTTHFGLTIQDPSGISFATDSDNRKRIGWIITAQKTGAVDLSGMNPQLLTLHNEQTKLSTYGPKRDSKTTVVNIEYPIFSYKQFEVYNPLTQTTSSVDSPSRKDIKLPVDPESETIFVSPQSIATEVKNQLSPEQWGIWRTLRREVETKLDRSYQEAEEILAGILIERGFHDQKEWSINKLRGVVNAETNRFNKRGSKTNA